MQVSYAIGVVEPMGVFVDTYGSSKVDLNDSQIAEKVKALFDLRPGLIEKNLKLRNPIYLETAAYGHMGRENRVVEKKFYRNNGSGMEEKVMEVELFTWEKTDYVDRIKKEFNL